jgi:uncharacterized protein with FMN-binding domain
MLRLNGAMSTALLEPEITDATAARLERLAARRTAPNGPIASPAGKGSAPKPRKGAPTNETKITALIASIATTGGLAFLLAPAGGTATAQSTVAVTPVVLQSSSAATTASSSGAASAAAATSAGTTVTGAVESNRFGNVQVSATFSSTGALTSVTLLQQPGDNHSVRINSSAVPTLTAEAVQAQSANINSVSGATYTSNSYTASLQAAIDTARAQGITTLA